MLSLYEILKASKTGNAPDMWTALAGANFGSSPTSTEHEYTGAVPVTFNADGEPLLDWYIKGNMQQSGTPTPQNPVMPQGTGERTGNLMSFPDIAETTKNGVTYYVSGNSLYINGTSTTAFGIAIRNAFTLKAGTYTNQMYGFTGRRIYYSFNNVSATMCASDVNLFKTFTISEDTTYASALVWINNGATFNNEKIDFALFESEEPKDYEPYGYKLDISSSNTTTPVYLGEVQTTRKIKKLVLTGGENNWTYEDAYERFGIGLSNMYVYETRLATIVCTHYPCIDDGRPIGEVPNNTIYAGKSIPPKLFIKTDSYTTINDFKSYLAAQYAAGTPVCVWYVLKTPQITTLNEPIRKIGEYVDTLSMEQAGVSIPTNNGSTTVDVETTLKPSEVYIKYKGV